MSDAAAGATELVDLLNAVAGAVARGTAAHNIDGLTPRAVVRPSDLDELSKVMVLAFERNIPVAPRGGGTRIALGNIPERLDAIVDLTGLDQVVSHNAGDLTATVQGGITLDGLQKTLALRGQFLALDPPLPGRATVGGTLATAVSGPLKWQYGSPRDVVIGMKVVQADGVVTKSGGQVVKNVSGYDMSRLHVGGLGTLGIIAEVSLKLTPLPANQATVLAAYDTMRQALEAGLAIFSSDILPLSLVVFDYGAKERMQIGDLQGSAFLAVRLGGRPRTVERLIAESQRVSEEHAPSHVEVMDEASSESMWRALRDFGWDETTTPAIGARAFVQPSAVPGLVETFEHSDGSSGMHIAVVCHSAHGTLLVSWYAEEEGPTTEQTIQTIQTIRNARMAVHSAGGKMVIEQCSLAVKADLDVWDDAGEPIAIMRRLKEQYDPKGILNPGRFVGGI